VRAGLVAEADAWIWSSAVVHCGATAADGWLTMQEWQGRWDGSSWREFLAAGEAESERMAVRQCTHTGRPLGTEEFVHELKETTKRPLAPRKGGRHAKLVEGEQQGELF
jgi:hypothetical protein